MTRKRRMCLGIVLLMASAAASFAVGASCVRDRSTPEIEKRLDRLEDKLHAFHDEVRRQGSNGQMISESLDRLQAYIEALSAEQETKNGRRP